jgi:adenosylmethionine-8-amino-7-oxononanoate aminotransferase
MLPSGENSAAGRMQSFWREALAPLQEKPAVAEVRICGCIAAVELAGAAGYSAPIGRELARRCLAQGVLLRPLGNVLYAMPPYCTSDQSLSRIASAMISAVTGISR